MPDTLEVRPLTGGHFEEAVYLVERFFAEEGFAATVAQIRTGLCALMSGEGSAVFVAELGGRAVGVATVTTTRGIELGLSAELEDLYVLPEARGAGVGAALIDTVKRWCRARGCTLVAVVVTPEGQAAHDLVGYYTRQGFAQTGRTLLFADLQDDAPAQAGSP